MDNTQLVEYIFANVRKHGEYVERPYRTIGGQWTVDTWKSKHLEGVKVQLTDEGYTQSVQMDGLLAVSTYGQPVLFIAGDRAMLEQLYNMVIENVPAACV